jgi:hypothetical protein
MPRRFLACLVFLFGVSPALAESGPVAAVRAIYAGYLVKTDRVADMPDQLAPKLYSARRRAELVKLKKACAKKDMCLPDADHFVDGQDYLITDLKITEIAVEAASARVAADFKNFDTREHMVFTLVKEGNRWVVDQLEGGKDDARYTLDDVLKPNF